MRLCLKSKAGHKGIFFFVLFSLALSTALMMFFLKRAEPIFKVRAADAATQEIRSVIDNIVADIIKDCYVFNSEETESVYDLNTIELNTLRTEFSKRLADKLNSTYYTKIYISVGSLFNNLILQGVGFRVPVRIFFGSISHIDIKDEFISAGINQTKYKVTLEISVSTAVVSAFSTDERQIDLSLPLAERIFIGDVPSYYIPKS